jgi:hypothetical protein
MELLAAMSETVSHPQGEVWDAADRETAPETKNGFKKF